jgi:hypothetical protein
MTDIKNLKVFCWTDKSKEPMTAIEWTDGTSERNEMIDDSQRRCHTAWSDPRSVSEIMSFNEALDHDIHGMDMICHDVIETMAQEFVGHLWDSLEELSITEVNRLFEKMNDVIADFNGANS